jgi:hypothetical protein
MHTPFRPISERPQITPDDTSHGAFSMDQNKTRTLPERFQQQFKNRSTLKGIGYRRAASTSGDDERGEHSPAGIGLT